jgi:hypothetical protein
VPGDGTIDFIAGRIERWYGRTQQRLQSSELVVAFEQSHFSCVSHCIAISAILSDDVRIKRIGHVGDVRYVKGHDPVCLAIRE